MNHLANETSPYLIEHAENPVDWYPFSPQALERARVENKPILLSIGYLACHWCHVMAQESFEDPSTAELMNRLYVNIKVDREERPDLDQIYQLAHEILVRRPGGWPLTVFLEPDDLTPFFAGTYFPRAPRFGLPAFPDILTRVEAYFRTPTAERELTCRRVREIFVSIGQNGAVADDRGQRDPASLALAYLARSFDARSGGFGTAPKFPRASALSFLLDTRTPTHASSGVEPDPHTQLTTTLTRMAEGGIYDHIGGGFFRYCVDEEWAIPHFEKMLYDNALLLPIYAEAACRTQMPCYRRVAEQTAAWALGSMRGVEGGFYSSLDADSDQGEGGYYLWEASRVESLLSPDEWRLLAPHYGLNAPSNFAGRWHLSIHEPQGSLAARFGLDEAVVVAHLHSGRMKLQSARAGRSPPRIDDKILVSSNGLMIAGLARAGRLLCRDDWVTAAECAARFIRNRLFPAGRLQSSYCARATRGPGFLHDHVFLLMGLLELLQARWNTIWYEWSINIADVLLERFEDRDRGGFWFTAGDQPVPLMRPKTWMDDAVPAANALAVSALALLGHLTGESRFLEAACRTLEAGRPHFESEPGSHLGLIRSAVQIDRPGRFMILRGDPGKWSAWLEQIQALADADSILFAIPSGEGFHKGLLSRCAPKESVCLYACSGTHCSAPVTTLASLTALLTGPDVV